MMSLKVKAFSFLILKKRLNLQNEPVSNVTHSWHLGGTDSQICVNPALRIFNKAASQHILWFYSVPLSQDCARWLSELSVAGLTTWLRWMYKGRYLQRPSFYSVHWFPFWWQCSSRSSCRCGWRSLLILSFCQPVRTVWRNIVYARTGSYFRADSTSYEA